MNDISLYRNQKTTYQQIKIIMETINGIKIANKVLHISEVEGLKIALTKDTGGYSALLIGQNILSIIYKKTKDFAEGFLLVDELKKEIAERKEQAKKFAF